MDLTTIPLLDHHCHPLRRVGELDGPGLRRHFSESTDPTMLPHIASAMFYGRGLRDLALLLDCDPSEEAVLAARHQQPAEQHARRLFEAANISTLLLDTGFSSETAYTLDEHRTMLPCAIHEVLRLEKLVEQLIVETESFAQLEDAYRAALIDLRARGIVALKSIAAYRGGLMIERRSRQDAAASYGPLKERARRDGRVRLSDRPLLEYIVDLGLKAAADQQLPFQLHTGFGDDDVDLLTANPLHLRPLLQDESLRAVRFVLLHTWPYVREAGYLAGIYGHVYQDLSLTVPFTAHGGAQAVLAALEQAPTSKVLLATDAFIIPELFYLGTLYARHSLNAALTQLQSDSWITASEAERAAQQMLYTNAAQVYGVE